MSLIYRDIGDPLYGLAEECAEVIQCVMKIKRFGLGDVSPISRRNNVFNLEEELNDLEYRVGQARDIIKRYRNGER